MTAFKWTAAIALLAISPTVLGASSNGFVVSHYEQLQSLVFATDASISDQKPGTSAPATLRFDALGRTFDLQLEPNNRLVFGTSRNAISDNLKIYRGQLTGNDASWVRIVEYDGCPRGLIWDGEQLFAVEAPGDSAVSTQSSIIYRLADTLIIPGAMACSDGPLSSDGATHYKSLTRELQAAKGRAPGAGSEILFSAIGDFEFTTAMGAGADAAIISQFNNVDGIFSDQLGIQITIQVL